MVWAPRELEDAVWESLVPTPGDAYAAGDGPTPRDVLDAVPDGWAKVNGEWVQVKPLGHAHVDCSCEDAELLANAEWRPWAVMPKRGWRQATEANAGSEMNFRNASSS